MGNSRSYENTDYTKLTEDGIQLLLEDTSFNFEQIKKWHEGFLVRKRNIFYNKYITRYYKGAISDSSRDFYVSFNSSFFPKKMHFILLKIFL